MSTGSEESDRLIRQIVEGDDVAARTERLGALGEAAVAVTLDALSGTGFAPPPSRHPRDVHDDLSGVLQAVAARNPAPVIAALHRRPEHAATLVWALGAAHAVEAVDALIGALGHPSSDVRWAAAAALERRPSKRAKDALIARLGDRSSRVRFAALRALDTVCDRSARPALERLLSKRLAPGERALAEAILARATRD